MPKPQFNVRLSEQGREILASLVDHFTKTAETGKPATQTEVIERALRALATREKIAADKIPRKK